MTGLAAGAMLPHCGGYGLPRRCAPRNDSFGSLMCWDGAARQICSCPAGASPRPTGAWPGPGALGRSCQADLQLPGRVMTLPYGCAIGAGCGGVGLLIRFAGGRRFVVPEKHGKNLKISLYNRKDSC